VLLDPESRDAGMAMLAAARAAGVRTSVDPQAADHLRDPAAFLAAVTGVDLLLPNTGELAALTGSTDPDSARDLLGAVGAVALTRGPDGACWVDADGSAAVPAVPSECVDSTGAGDAFDAALLTAWLSGADPAAALRAGVSAGSAAVRQLGAHPPRAGR
jgi:sugar/nucleoside kinase (ribokinase family)